MHFLSVESARKTSHHGLPESMTKEVLNHYADIVRTGQMHINDVPLSWEVTGNTSRDFDTFGSAFFRRVMRLNSDVGVDGKTLSLSLYWVCKVVSVNFALIEVMDWLRLKTNGSFVTVHMRSNDGDNAQYHLTVLPGFRFRVGLKWLWEGNVLEVCPNGSKEVRGTLSKMYTEFDVPPKQDFVPTFTFKFKLAKAHFLASLGRARRFTETFELASPHPIHGDSCEEHTESFVALSPTPSWSDVSAQGSLGVLHVYVAQATGVNGVNAVSIFVTCAVAGEQRRTAAVPNCPDPTWNESLQFVLRAQDLRRSAHACVLDENGVCLGKASVPVSTVLLASFENCSAIVRERLTDTEFGGSLELHFGFVPNTPPSASDVGDDGSEKAEQAITTVSI
jgi:hypothetical protein